MTATTTCDVATVDLASVDLTDLDWFAEGVPHALFARMRREAPVRWNRSAKIDGFWCLTRASDIRRVAGDPSEFSSAEGGVFLTPDTIAPLELARSWVLFQDPPDHSKYRSLVAAAFRPRMMILIEDMVHEIITDVLDGVVSKGECDLSQDVALPIALRVVARMMGAPPEDVEALRRWVDDIGAALAYDTDCVESLQKMGSHLSTLVNNQIVRGVGSLANALAEAEVDGERLDENGIALYFAALLWAGVNPTRSAIAGGMLELMRNPDQLVVLRREQGRLRLTRSGLVPVAVNEVLRWTSPVNYLSRTALRDTTVGGTPIKAGDRLVMWFASGNRDEDEFADADKFNTLRKESEMDHMAYSGGPHRCQGAFLANRIISMSLMEILKRMPGLELAGSPEWERSNFVNALTALPVKFSAA